MYERSKAYTPEDRILRWLSTWVARFQHGIPTDLFVRHLKGDLTGITFGQLDLYLKRLESEGMVRREWDTPGEYRVFLTEAGAQRAKALEDRGAKSARPPPREGPRPPSAAFVAPPAGGTSPAAPLFTPQAEPAPSPAFGGEAGTTSLPASFAEGRSSGPIPSQGPPAAANLAVRVLLYCYLNGTEGPEGSAPIPGENLSRYLLNQGFLLSEDYLAQLFDGLQRREVLRYLPRPSGGYDLELSPRGRNLAEGLLSGGVRSSAPSEPSAELEKAETATVPLESADPAAATTDRPWVTTPVGAPAPDAGSPEGTESNPVGSSQEELRRALAESEEKRKLDRETLDEVLHQLEVQASMIHELKFELDRERAKSGEATSEGSDPSPT